MIRAALILIALAAAPVWAQSGSQGVLDDSLMSPSHYPPAAADAGGEAVCRFSFTIEADGERRDLCVACRTNLPEGSSNLAESEALFAAAIEESLADGRHPPGPERRYEGLRFFSLDEDAEGAAGIARPVACAQQDGPRPLHRTPAIYPGGLWQEGIVAHCTAIFSVNASGRPRDVCVECASNSPETWRARRNQRWFEAAARTAVGGWRYEAGRPGSGVEVQLTFTTDDMPDDALPPKPQALQCRPPAAN